MKIKLKYNLIFTLFFSANVYADIYEYSGAKKHAACISEPEAESIEDGEGLESLFKRLLKNCNKCQKLKDSYSIDDVKETETFHELSNLNLATKNAVLRKALNDLNNLDEVKNNPNWMCLVVATLFSGADPNLRTDQGHTNLHMASFIAEWTNSVGFLELLLRLGADPNEKCLVLYPLEFSYDNKIKDLLIKYGAYRRN